MWEEQQKRERGKEIDHEIKRTVSRKPISVMIMNLLSLSTQGLEGLNTVK